jgi:hypothetical protein
MGERKAPTPCPVDAVKPPPPPAPPDRDVPNHEIRYLGDLQRLALKPGDRLVLRVDHLITAEQSARLREGVSRWAGGATVLVLESGMTLGAVGADDAIPVKA